MLLNLFIVIITFIIMEGVAWVTHKYIMHGILWTWHRSHHRLHSHALERNDLFALVFSLPSILCIYLGFGHAQLDYLLFIGIGIFLYGIAYFLFHDIIVHRRIKTPHIPQSNYMKKIIKAHYIHHEKHSKHGCKFFGFLYINPSKIKKQT